MSYLPDELYQKVTESMPIVCVDMVPVRSIGASEWEIGVITRGTGSQAGKICLLGGRIWHNETITDSLKRHLITDLGVTAFSYFQRDDFTSPFYVQQYIHGTASKSPYGFDPSKHAIALTYLLTIDDIPKPKNEAIGFHWVRKHEVPVVGGYNQQIVMRAAFDRLETGALNDK